MKLSTKNQLKGKVMEVTKGATTSHVRIEIGQGVTITSFITNERWQTSGSRRAMSLGSDQGIRCDNRQVRAPDKVSTRRLRWRRSENFRQVPERFFPS